MIISDSDIRHPKLRDFWASGGATCVGLPPDQVKRLRMILAHLHTARSLKDISQGLGELRKHHKLKGYPHRYAMWVTGNYRVTYDCADPSTGVVTVIDYEDYH